MRQLYLFSSFLKVASAAQWAFIAAGSTDWGNKKHQAETAHVYQLLVKRGVPPHNIVTMLSKDVVNDTYNPI